MQIMPRKYAEFAKACTKTCGMQMYAYAQQKLQNKMQKLFNGLWLVLNQFFKCDRMRYNGRLHFLT